MNLYRFVIHPDGEQFSPDLVEQRVQGDAMDSLAVKFEVRLAAVAELEEEAQPVYAEW